MTEREKAIVKRNIFLSVCGLILILAIALVVFIVSVVVKDQPEDSPSKPLSKVESVSSEVLSGEASSDKTPSSEAPQIEIGETPHGLDAEYENLLLVNGWNPLPDDFDYEGHLTTIPQGYLKGSLDQIDKEVWPYLKAMLDDARSKGVDIGVWSPYRSYATQKWLFEKQVKKQIEQGVPEAEAEDKAATVVARPGTSEHNCGLALDINCANDSFEATAAYKWLTENAEDYGFVMRYSKEKQEKTGVIHESWHWRFVGIKAAHEMNALDMCLEEYVEYKK